jgi:hypothetical protein
MSNQNDFNFSRSVNEKNISDGKIIPDSRTNIDYSSLSTQDKTDILFALAFIFGIGSLIGNALWNLLGG